MNPSHPDDDEFDRDRNRSRNSRDRDDDYEGDRGRRGRDRDDDYESARGRRDRDRDDDDWGDDRRRGRNSRHFDDTTFTAGEWIVAIICSTIGCVVGIVWLIQGNPKGGKMLGLSILFDIIKSVIYLAATDGKGFNNA